MIIAIQILIITALVLVNIILLDKAKPVIKDAAEDVQEAVQEIVHPKEPDPEYKRLLTILDNIDKYDGSGKGQVKI